MVYAVFDRISGDYFKKYTWNSEMNKYSAWFGELDSGIKQYKSVRAARSAINNIVSVTGYEGALDVDEIEGELPPENPAFTPYEELDKPAEAVREKPEPEELPPLYPVTDNDKEYWEIIAFVGEKKKPPLMLRKQFARTYSYAIKMPDGGFFYLPGDELLAWARYYDECKRFVCGRIRERRIREGRDPGGMDEWRR